MRQNLTLEEVHKINIDIFKEFVEVCKRVELKYYMTFGSLIGTLRHKGFIPWDDDIDVCMFRDDYEKFKEIWSKLNPYHFYQLHECHDEDYHLQMMKIEDRRTSSTNGLKFGRYYGVSIDIFPLDYFPDFTDDRFEFHHKRRKLHQLWHCRYEWKYFTPGYLLKKLPTIIKSYFVSEPTIAMDDYFKSLPKGKFVGVHGCIYWNDHRELVESFNGEERFGEFEGMQVRIPYKAEDMLTRIYSEWRTAPKEYQYNHDTDYYII